MIFITIGILISHMQTSWAQQFTSTTEELIIQAESQSRGANELKSKHPKLALSHSLIDFSYTCHITPSTLSCS